MIHRTAFAFFLAVAAALLTLAARTDAAAVEIKVEAPYLRTIQPNAGTGKVDDIYLLVTGVAQGKEVARQFPEGKTWKSSPREPAITEKAPLTLWEGKLEEGQFIALTVATFANEPGGKINEAKRKEYFEKKAASDKKVSELTGAVTDRKTLDTLRSRANKQNVEFFKAIGDIFPKRKGDNYIGSFDVIAGNIGGKIQKRIMPTGLLHGEHYGLKVKAYSKLKWTLQNVVVQNPENGQFFEVQLPALLEEEDGVRVKMTEVELLDPKDEKTRTVTDYLMDVKVHAAGMPLFFELSEQVPDTNKKQIYWNWAE